MTPQEQKTHPRTARLVLVTPDDVVIGCLPPMLVSTPYWQDAEAVVQTARKTHGVDITILRLLETERAEPPGGCVTYLAEIAERIPTDPWSGNLDYQPLRQSFAQPGGPAADLAWAASILKRRGLQPVGRPEQVRSWNLLQPMADPGPGPECMAKSSSTIPGS